VTTRPPYQRLLLYLTSLLLRRLWATGESAMEDGGKMRTFPERGLPLFVLNLEGDSALDIL